MLSRFFIDRPIFATVLSVCITLIGAIALSTLPLAQYPRITPPGVVIAITYPGANAQTVAQTVAAPVEQQVTGVPGMLYMSSLSGNDGSYQLTCTFDVATNLNAAVVMVQNRVTLAMPLLPTAVQRQGITIRKRTPDILLMTNFTSPKGTYNEIYLSNFVLANVRDELLRVDGVADINIMGQRDYSIRAWLDPQKLAARNLTAVDVANAVRSQNIEAALGQVGQAPMSHSPSYQLPLATLGRLSDPEQFKDIIVKVRSTRPPSAPQAPTSAPAGGMTVPGSQLWSPVQGTTALAAGGMSLGTGTTGTTAGLMGGAATAGMSVIPSIDTSISIPSSGMPAGMYAAANTLISPGMQPAITPAGGGAGGSTALLGATTAGGGTTGGGATTGGGGTAGGGATTAGGAFSAGGGQTGGGANAGAAMGDDTSAGMTGMPMGQLMLGGAGQSATSITAPVSATRGTAQQAPTTAIVRLRDVARVEMGALNYNQAAFFDGKPTIGLMVYQLPTANALDVADRVKAKIAELSQRFPEDLVYTIGYDTTPFIRESISEVFRTLLDAVLLVAIVVLVFLQDWKAMILPMIDVPVSLIGTFAVMVLLGYSLNNISLFGLVLAIGIVVDDAIVVLENIERQIAKGYAPREATLRAMDEITGPIIAITLVLSAVFVPCAFISGITGRFFQQFAVTIAASTIISAVNALTMTPSRALLILRRGGLRGGHGGAREALPWWIFGVIGGWLMWSYGPSLLAHRYGLPQPGAETPTILPQIPSWALHFAWATPGFLAGLLVGRIIIRPVNAVLARLFRAFDYVFDGITAIYGWTIAMAMRLAVLVLVLYAGLLVVTWWMFRTAPTGFVPQQDMGRCMAGIQLPDSSSLERTKEAALRIEKIARETPGVAHTISICGMSFVQQSNGSNFGSLFIILKPFAERQKPELKDEAIMAKMRRRWTKEVKEAAVVVFGAPTIPGISVAGGFKTVVEDRAGLGPRSLQEQTDALIGELKKSPSLIGVSTQFRSRIPQLYLDVDWSKVAALGLTPEDVNQTLEIFLGSSYVNSFNALGRYWQVTLQADKEFRSHVRDVNLMQIRNKWGQMVPLGTIATIKETTGPIFINRYNLYTAAPITGTPRPGVDTGDVIAVVDKTAHETLPRSMRADWTELMYLQILEGNTTPPHVVFGLSVLFVFLALAALYESWTLPLAVILVVPLCVLFTLTGIWYTGTSLNIFVQVGLVVLVGLASKNAILIVEFAREKHADGMPVLQATREASELRLRPIVMTSFAFILGVAPLVFASGAGAEMRRSLGTAVFSGMLGVTLFGVFLTPVFFYFIQGFGEAPLFSAMPVRRAISGAFGMLAGFVGGYLLARLGVCRLNWALPGGACAGLLGVIAVSSIHRRILGSGGP
jgi:multidrug efflux pump